MKTLFCFNTWEDNPKFFELEGDYSRLDGIQINGVAPKGINKKTHGELVDELLSIVYVPDSGDYRVTMMDKPTKDWDFFVHCGFIP